MTKPYNKLNVIPSERLLNKARRISGMPLKEGPYSDTELENFIRDYQRAKAK